MPVRRILVDADACPVRAEVARAGRSHGLPVTLVCGPAQDFAVPPGAELRRVDSGPEVADLALANLAGRQDLVVLEDVGLAALILARGARVLTFCGRELHPGNIDAALAERHRKARLRRGGGRHRGPRAYTAEDRARFVAALATMLECSDS